MTASSSYLDKLAAYERLIQKARSPLSVRRTMNSLRQLLARGLKSAPEVLAEKAAECSPYTVRDLHRALVAFGKFAGYPSLAKLPKPRAGGSHRDRAVFSADDVSKLAACEAIPEARRLFWRMMYRLGLRVKEAMSVTPTTIRRDGGGWKLVLPEAVQKAGRQDTVPVPEDLAREVQRLAPASRSGWIDIVGTARTIGRTFDRDLRSCGVGTHQGDAHRTPYDLRSFFVSELLRRGVPIPAVQTLARHADANTTLTHYARMTADEARESGSAALEGL